MEKKYTILISNDDGIDAPGIHALARALNTFAKVIVCAPNQQRSAAGHSLSLNEVFKVQKRTLEDGIEGYAIWGTPRDCVEVAVQGILKEKPDLIVTGINEGPNCGADMVCSGTIGSASVGCYFGIPAIAVSLDRGKSYDFTYSAKVAVACAKWFIEQPFNKNFVLNVNVPNVPESEVKGVSVVKYGGMHDYCVQYDITEDDEFMYFKQYMTGLKTLYSDETIEGDLYAMEHGYVTINPISLDVVQYASMSHLNTLKEILEKE